MKKRLLVAYVASTLAGIGGVSSAALTSTKGAPRPGASALAARMSVG